jgi:hypothetical protein
LVLVGLVAIFPMVLMVKTQYFRLLQQRVAVVAVQVEQQRTPVSD